MSAEKFFSPCPLPTPYEAELLTILIEECAEVQQRATKLLRFGRDEVQPGQPLSNAQRLSQELGDLEAVILLCQNERLISKDDVAKAVIPKLRKLEKFMQTSAPPADREGK